MINSYLSESTRETPLQESLKQTGIPVLWESEVREITGDNVVRSVKVENRGTKALTEMAVDGVFIGIGYAPSNDIAKKLGLELTTDGYINTDLATMRTSAPHIYAAGDITGQPEADRCGGGPWGPWLP